MDYCIETRNLSREFDGFWAVNQLNLEVERGCFYGFLGPNGAGKSTSIKMLTGLLAPSGGSVHIFGQDLDTDGIAIKQRIGVVPEDLCVFENLTAMEYLMFIGRMYGMEKKVIQERREELLQMMELQDHPKTLILEYSNGMRKKLAVAAALIHDPELLFLDEPFEGMDAIAARTLKGVLDVFVKRDSTVFLTSHILDIVERLCTHVGIIHEGQLITQSPIGELIKDGSLESAFIEAVGNPEESEAGLSWLKETTEC